MGKSGQWVLQWINEVVDEDNGPEVHSTQILRKSVVAETFIRTLKTKIDKPMTTVLEYVYIDNLDETVDIYY